MFVYELKELLKNVDNENRVVVFEHTEDGQPANESFGIDHIEPRSGTFLMLVSKD